MWIEHVAPQQKTTVITNVRLVCAPVKSCLKEWRLGMIEYQQKCLKIRFGILSGSGAFEGLKDMSFR